MAEPTPTSPDQGAPQREIARGVIPIEANTESLDRQLDAIEERVERIGRAFGDMLDGALDRFEGRLGHALDLLRSGQDGIVETGEARTDPATGVSVTPVRVPEGVLNDVRVADDIQNIRIAVEQIRDSLQQEGGG
jgi:hypothetical protein